MLYYICQGQMPRDLIRVKAKSNTMFNVTVLVTITCHILTYLHIRYKKAKKQVLHSFTS
jgi:hypothetical protein